MIRRLFLVLLTVLGVALLAIGGLVVVASFSPWPGVLLITKVFSRNDAASEAALEKHVPSDIETRTDLRYGDGPDETFDINYPANANRALPLVLWIHGGGWVGGSKDGVANYLKVLSSRGYTVVGINYSRAPIANHPTPARQTLAALGYLTTNANELRIDPDQIVLAGDSAGAQIAGQTAMVITDRLYADRVGLNSTINEEALRAIVLVSGALDMSELNLDGKFGWFVRTVLWAYSGVRDFMNDEQFMLASITPNVSPAFPPAFIASGDADPLEPQAKALAHRLTELGVETSTVFFDPRSKLNHEYQFNLDIPEGRSTLDELVRFLAQHLKM